MSHRLEHTAPKAVGHYPRLYRAVLVVALGWVSLLAVGCGVTGSSSIEKETVMSSIPLSEVKEGTSPREAAAKLAGITSWLEPTATGAGWNDSQSARDAVEKAISTNAVKLQAVDYAALSLPAFVTTTRTLNLKEGQIDGRGQFVEAFGNDTRGGRWALYAWRGPEIPQRPDRLIVHRWVHVYALVDLTTVTVTHLFPTVTGEVYE